MMFPVVTTTIATFYLIRPAAGNFQSAAPLQPSSPTDSPVFKIRVLPASNLRAGAIGRGARINRINDISSSVASGGDAQQQQIALSTHQQQEYELRSIMVIKGHTQNSEGNDDEQKSTTAATDGITIIPRMLRIAGGAYPVYYVIAVANGRFNGSNIRAIKSKFSVTNKARTY